MLELEKAHITLRNPAVEATRRLHPVCARILVYPMSLTNTQVRERDE